MNTTAIAESLNKEIDRHAAGVPVGKLESHDLASLCRRILAPREVVEKLLSAGVLRAEGPVYAGDETGRHSFASDTLNEVRRAVLAAIVERIVEESDGAPEQVTLAAGHALREHVGSFAKKKDGATEFSRFPAGIIQLARYGDPVEEPGLIERTAATAGKVAAVGGLAYGGAALLRGRSLAPGASLLDQLRKGAAANNATGRAIAGRIGAGASRVAEVLAGRMPR